MSHFDHSDLDGRLLKLLVAVIEEGSITRAAQRLDVTQSAVSHLLDKLRAIVGDPLFVKSGRGIVPTARAEALAVRARVLLDDLRAFTTAGEFDPARVSGDITIAANDFQRDLLLPSLLARLRRDAPGVTLRVIASGVPSAEMLREERCQLIISPRLPDAGDVMHKRLFADRYAVFFDAAHRAAPASLADYLAAEHVSVLYEPHRLLELDRTLEERGVRRRFAVRVPGFAGIPAFLRGSTALATLPSRLGDGAGGGLMHGFARVEPPLDCPPIPMFMAWHLRHQEDPQHQWLRRALDAVVQTLGLAER